MPALSRRETIGLGVALPAASIASVAHAADPIVAPVQGAGWYGFRFGEARCRVVSDGMIVLAGAPQPMFATNATEGAVAAVLEESFLPHDQTLLHLNAVHLEIGDRRVLIDAGGGSLGPATGRLSQNLRSAGLDPLAIDTVVVSHAHPEQVFGTLTAAGEPAFPNARFVLHGSELTYWEGTPDFSRSGLEPNLRRFFVEGAKRHLAVLKDRIDPIQPGHQIAPGLEALGTPGHTPGHLSFRYRSGDATLYITGDVLHHPAVALAHPEWHVSFDHDPDLASGFRRLMLDQLATGGLLTLAYRFPFPGLGYVARRSDAYSWVPLTWSWDPEADLA